jgi:hypothetical protein
MTSESVVLAGVDTLIMNAKYPCQEPSESESKGGETSGALPDHLTEALEIWLEQAKKGHEPVKVAWKHETNTFLLSPHGTQTHRYLLKNGLIDLMLEPLLINGAPARVRFSSEYLWRRGVEEALINTHAFLWDLFQDRMEVQPSEIHLCADVAGLQVPRNYERLFVSNATKWRPVKLSQLDKPIYRHHRLETLQFSDHGNPVSVTIYDKRAEIEQQSREKRWFYDLWKQRGWDGEAPVWRVECRLKREALHEMDIEEAYQALEKAPALWAYCVGYPGQKNGWVRMVDPNTRDTNRWRWNTAGAWTEVQKAFMQYWQFSENVEAVQRQRKRQENLDRAEKAIAGYTTTYAAWLREELGSDDDVSVVLQRLYSRMLTLWEQRGTNFQAQRRKKEDIYHIDRSGSAEQLRPGQ